MTGIKVFKKENFGKSNLIREEKHQVFQHKSIIPKISYGKDDQKHRQQKHKGLLVWSQYLKWFISI